MLYSEIPSRLYTRIKQRSNGALRISKGDGVFTAPNGLTQPVSTVGILSDRGESLTYRVGLTGSLTLLNNSFRDTEDLPACIATLDKLSEVVNYMIDLTLSRP